MSAMSNSGSVGRATSPVAALEEEAEEAIGSGGGGGEGGVVILAAAVVVVVVVIVTKRSERGEGCWQVSAVFTTGANRAR
jgi:hypothetical protein